MDNICRVCILSSTTRRLHPVHTDLCQQESLSSGNIGRVGGWVLLQYFNYVLCIVSMHTLE